jgi:CHAT domain-containing protein
VKFPGSCSITACLRSRVGTNSFKPRALAVLLPLSSLVTLLVVLAVACSCRPSDGPEAVYREITAQYIRAELAQAVSASVAAARRWRSDPQWFWRFRLLQAESLLALGRVGDASELLQNPVPPGEGTHQLEIRRMVDQADAALKSRQLDDAATLLDAARAGASDPAILIRIDLLDGSVLMRRRNIPAAEQAFRRALMNARSHGDQYSQASALLNLALAKQFQSHFDEGLELGEQALSLARAAGARRVMAAAHNNIGISLSRLGDFEHAIENQRDSEKLYAAVGDRGNILNPLGETGNVYLLGGEPQKAIDPFDRAFELAQNLHRDDDAALWAGNLANAAIAAGQLDEAEHWNEAAARIAARLHDSRRELFVRMNSALIAQWRKDTDRAIQLFTSINEDATQFPGLRMEAHDALGALHADAGRFSDANREFEAALAIVERNRSDVLQTDLKIMYLSRLIKFYQDYVDVLVQQGNDDRALQIADSSRSRVLAEKLGRIHPSQRLDLKRIQRLSASSNTMLLSFWIAPKRSFVWLITPARIRRFTLPPAQEIEPLVASYRQRLENMSADNPAGVKLWQALLAQVAPLIPKGSRVAIIPDGPLHPINLETLPPGPGRQWIDDVEIAVAPALSILSEAGKMSKSPLLAIGAPVPVNAEYPALPNAGTEIATIQRKVGETVAYTGARAVPAAYRDSQPGRFSLIHFAAHAEANREVPLDSAVILSQSGENYKLYARDVIEIPIRASVVTISGCRSAGVRAYAGEGLIGFAWAFLQAGAQAVVAGLWDVSDSSTEPLMARFYDGIAAGQAPSAALRGAKLALRNGRYAKPYYWAPFQIYVRAL